MILVCNSYYKYIVYLQTMPPKYYVVYYNYNNHQHLIIYIYKLFFK